MKRIICFVLSLTLIFSLSACGKEEKENKNGVDIEYFAELGQMPECEYSIGDNVSDIKTALKTEAENNHDAVYDFIEGEKTALIDGGQFNYYYLKDKENDGISYIINYGTAYGFENGAVILEIKDALKGVKVTEEEINEDNAFFLLGEQNGTVLKAEFSEYTVSFIFTDNALIATAIYLTNDWK